MGRKLGTNVYSNNFEPQVMGLLDARTQVDTKADLTKDATWTSTDGNTYAPVGIRVSVTDDSTNGNNGVYMLMSEDYAIASNWMKIGSEGNAEFIMVDLSSINSIPGTYSPDRYTYEELTKIIDATSINIPFFVFAFDATEGLFATSCVTNGAEFLLTILYRDEIWCIAFNGDTYTTYKVEMGSGGGSSTSNVKVLTTQDLLNTSRVSSISLSSSDVAVWKNLEIGRDIVVYSGATGQTKQYIPLSIATTGSGTIQIGAINFMFGNSIYFINISTTNSTTYTASAPKKIEGSGSAESNVEIIDLSEIAAVNDKKITASASLKTELEKLYDVVASTKIAFANYFDNIEGKYPISIKDDSGTNTTFSVLFNNELWAVDYNRATSTYSTTKVENGQGGGGSAVEIVELPTDASTNLPYENGYYDGNSQDFANKIREISINPTKIYMLKYSPTGYYTIINPYRSSIYTGFYVATNDDVLHFYTEEDANVADYTIQSEGSVNVKQDTLVSGKNIKTINGKSILGSGNIDISGGSGADVLKVSLYDLQPISGTYTVSLGDYSYDSIIALHDSRSSGKVMYAYEFNGEMGMFNISINDLDVYTFYLDYLNKKIKVEYSINRDNTITCIVTDVTKHDLSIDVKAGYDGIYYRIREVVPNGYIHFVRKKKKKYYSITQNKWFNQTTYSPMGLSFNETNAGVSASTLTPNVWYKYPITNEELVNTYTAGSKNPEGVIVTYDMYKFSGNTHAKPIFFSPNGGTIGSKRTTVLNAGLQYNVLDSSFVSNTSAKTIFRQRGDIRKIDVRLSVNSINTFSSGYKLIYAIK